MLSFLKNISPTEMIIIAVVLIILFGSKIFISLARTAGESLKEVKKVKNTFKEAVGDGKDKKD